MKRKATGRSRRFEIFKRDGFACVYCGATPPDAVLEVDQSMAARAALVEEREAQVLAYHEILQAARERHEADCWLVAEIYMGAFSDAGISRDYFASIVRFLKLLDVYDAMEAMDLATSKGLSRRRTFLYFCRVCWNQINAPQEE